MPGSTPATSQLDWLISTTAMIVLFWSRATRDLLKSFGWGIAALHRLMQRRSCHPRRPPHRISPVEGDGFEPSVPGTKEPVFVAEGELRYRTGAAKKGCFLCGTARRRIEIMTTIRSRILGLSGANKIAEVAREAPRRRP